jgi:hypothetical protein
MRSSTAAESGFKIPKRKYIERDTADYIFSKDEQLNFNVDTAHFRAKNRSLHRPTVTSNPVEEEMNWIANQPVNTYGCVWDMVEYFIDGATLGFNDKSIAEIAYKRILDHFNAHIKAQRSDKMYMPPDIEDFRMMGEFATAIRTIVVDINPLIDKPIFANPLDGLRVRPTFSKSIMEEKKEEGVVAKSIEQMDIIEQYMEMYHG